jgi:DnaJ-class molecular chaperone
MNQYIIVRLPCAYCRGVGRITLQGVVQRCAFCAGVGAIVTEQETP